MATAVEFLRGYGIDIRERWADEIKAQIVAESLKPGMMVKVLEAHPSAATE